jgi:hypothetical protein
MMMDGHAIALSFLLSAAALQPAPAPFDTDRVAGLIRPTLPRAYSGGLIFREVSVEDGVLVALVTGPRAAFDEIGRTELARLFAEGFCRQDNGRSTFAAGFRMRLDTQDDGGTRIEHGLVVDHCPEPAH